MIPEFLRNPPDGKPWLLYGALGASLLLNLVLATRLGGDEPVAAAPTSPDITAMGDLSPLPNDSIPADKVMPLPEKRGVARAAGVHTWREAVTTSLGESFTRAPATSPAALTQVYERLFTWDLDMRRDLHRGDVVEVLYEQPARGEPLVLAARLRSKPGTDGETVHEAWRYHAPGDRFASYWKTDGEELPARLIDGPLDDYEQMTRRTIDGRPGVEFKTPVGNAVLAPRAGVIKKINANVSVTGQSVEMEYPDGVHASFFHMNDVAVKVGDRISAGTTLGTTGNTGRSTIPHLRYELSKGNDPLTYHGTLRRTLPPEVMPDFEQKKAELASQLGAQLALAE